jgi:hypothetical protein
MYVRSHWRRFSTAMPQKGSYNNHTHQPFTEPTLLPFPFTRLTSPKLILLPAFIAVWFLVAILGIYLWGAYLSRGDFREAAHQIWGQRTIVSLVALAIAAIIGLVNYLLSRRFRGTSWKDGLTEAFLVIDRHDLKRVIEEHLVVG